MDAGKTGELIAQVRKEKGLTQKDLAEGLHVSVQAVSKWERGRSCPDIALLEPLAETLELTVTELLSGQRGEQPREALVRDSLRFGLEQLGSRVRRWKWLFILAASLLLAVTLGFGYVWIRDNTELLPQTETTVQSLEGNSRESTLTQASAKSAGHLYRVDFASDVTMCSFCWELWTSQGLEQNWDGGELERYSDERHKLIAVTWNSQWNDPDIRYGITLESDTGVVRYGLQGTLEDVPYMSDAMGITLPTKRAAVDPEEGTILLVFTLLPDGKFYIADQPHCKNGRMELPPTSETAKYLLLRMYCE